MIQTILLLSVILLWSLITAYYIKPIVTYLRPTIEGRDGKPSMKRLTVFISVVMFVVTWLTNLVLKWTIESGILYVLGSIILGAMGITANENIQNRKIDPSGTESTDDGKQPGAKKDTDKTEYNEP